MGWKSQNSVATLQFGTGTLSVQLDRPHLGVELKLSPDRNSTQILKLDTLRDDERVDEAYIRGSDLIIRIHENPISRLSHTLYFRRVTDTPNFIGIELIISQETSTLGIQYGTVVSSAFSGTVGGLAKLIESHEPSSRPNPANDLLEITTNPLSEYGAGWVGLTESESFATQIIHRNDFDAKVCGVRGGSNGDSTISNSVELTPLEKGVIRRSRVRVLIGTQHSIDEINTQIQFAARAFSASEIPLGT